MILKKILTVLVLVWSLVTLVSFASAQEESAKIYFFYGIGCPHCSQVETFFTSQDLYNQYPIEKKEIYFDRDNAVLFTQLLDDLNVPREVRGVPTVIIGDQVLVGDTQIIANFITAADKFLGDKSSPKSSPPLTEPKPKAGLDLTLAAVIGASIVDAINPCAFAVLIILMTTILATGKANKALKAGFFFATSIFISYFFMGLGLYKALGVGQLSHWFFQIVGWLAIILGLLNLKDYFWYGKGFLMEVPMSWRPRLKIILQSVTSPLGAFGIGFLVSLFLLPCTSGPYIVILGMLAKKVLQAKAIFYLILYNLIFVSPMILITLAVYKGFDPQKAEAIRQKRLKLLHLIAGIIMLVMGGVILLGWV